MVRSKTPKKETSPAISGKKALPDPAQLKANFVSTAVTMGWQLAVVVVGPIVGGYELDQRNGGTSSLWEVIGFIIAGLGFYGVLRYQLRELNDMNGQRGADHDK